MERKTCADLIISDSLICAALTSYIASGHLLKVFAAHAYRSLAEPYTPLAHFCSLEVLSPVSKSGPVSSNHFFCFCAFW